ncbi:GDP-mannose 4,6-dehydratase [Methylobacter sp. S3L5C]|uniref:GDP-mannose 4,6-dehydratase n=1 Tax=Methylobacter sp. S3L5C TaxID=2839024 RepID=UPI001FABCF04|nr:GDP-mannose 4,6-dehydratase [Methylobacter sp. S3L5C]UOA09524.1 GDP-mannose 4,6-dehydratase [Methylobacter sp. S3L5C]
MTKTALITGIGGQDGAYLAQLLISKGYRVFGTSRDAGASRFDSLARLGISGQVNLLSMAPHDFKSTLTAISKARPDEIYHLAGQTSVGLSFEQPSETIESITIGTLNILESLRFLELPARFYHAGSSECFGDTGGVPANEHTPFNPVSPYAVAKSAAHWLVRNYREAHNMFAANGILFNHESELRPARFVTQKVVQAAHRISCGSSEKLTLGDLSISRDWGWAPEYVEAMWRILQADHADDFVIATGETNSLKDFVIQSFACFGLDWTEHVLQSDQFMRPNEITWSQGNPDKAEKILGWKASKRMRDVVKILCGV